MAIELVQYSVVVTGDAHNPSILNPDFLADHGVVPKAWGWEVAETFTTPPFAMVRYKDAASISVEPTKLHVVDGNIEGDPRVSRSAEIACSYVKTLPYVKYTAVGINFQSIIDTPSPEQLLKDRFLKPGPWNSSAIPLEAAGYRLVYGLPDGGRVTLSLDSGEVQKAEDSAMRSVVIARANFNRRCHKHPTSDEVAAHLENVPTDWVMYQELLKGALAEEIQA